jgi:hypothetical protein
VQDRVVVNGENRIEIRIHGLANEHAATLFRRSCSKLSTGDTKT